MTNVRFVMTVMCIVALFVQANAASAEWTTSPQMATIWRQQLALANNTVARIERATSLKQVEEIVIQTTAATRSAEQSAFRVWQSSRSFNDWVAWRACLYYTIGWSALVEDIYCGRVYDLHEPFGDRFTQSMSLVGSMLDFAGLPWQRFW